MKAGDAATSCVSSVDAGGFLLRLSAAMFNLVVILTVRFLTETFRRFDCTEETGI